MKLLFNNVKTLKNIVSAHTHKSLLNIRGKKDLQELHKLQSVCVMQELKHENEYGDEKPEAEEDKDLTSCLYQSKPADMNRQLYTTVSLSSEERKRLQNHSVI